MMHLPPRIVCPVALMLLGFWSSTQADEDWSRWRGPQQNGHAEDERLPVTWSAESVVWKTDLPGEGQSSPIVWEDRIFLTSALERGRQRVVLCVDRKTGRILWQRVAWTGTPEPSHKMNGWASASCATDGERVYAFFGRGGGLFCYSVDGELLWSKDLGIFEGPWGTAASPVLVGDLVIQNCDADADAYLVAFHKVTGEEVWKSDREDFRGWNTPILLDVNGRQELLVNGHTGVRAYDPATGKELWYCESEAGRGEPTITPGEGVVYVVNGLRGPMYAVRPGGQGTVTATHQVWKAPRASGRDLPSPILVGDFLLLTNMQGILTCYDAATGKEHWRERIGGNYAASPISYKGLAFFLNEAGETVVIRPDKTPEIIARNTIGGDDELFRASITPDDGQLLIRSNMALYCVGAKQ